MKDLKNMKKLYVYVVAFVVVMTISFLYKYFLNSRADGMLVREIADNSGSSNMNIEIESEVSESIVVTETLSEETTLCEVNVYICGAVNNPGVYRIAYNSLLYEVIDIAGGFNEDAATDYINLVYEIRENVSIYIPTVNEVSDYVRDESGLVRGSEDYFIWGSSSSTDGSTSITDSSELEGRVNINTASMEELMTLPGIGESTAQAIINYRTNNPFNSIEDIMNVSGIGNSKFDRIRDYICV